jgi:NADH-quinone oxidoreductase subunit H
VSDAADVLRILSRAVFGVGAALLAGVYAVAVLDRVVGRAVARMPLRLIEAAADPAREAALLLLQRRTVTERPDAAVWALAPALLGSLAAAALVAIPLSAAVALPDIGSGIVYFGAAMAMVMVAVYVHGWSANSVFPLIGAYRFVAQALSYEMPLALVLIAVALPAESLSVGDIVRAQAGTWNVVRQPLGLPLYLIAGLGLAFWGPLNFPDAADLSGGTRAELSGAPLLLWRAARSAVLVAVAAMGASACLGGWLGPWLPGAVWMVLKTLALLVVLLTAGHLVARVRLERFVVVAWTVLIPLALVDIFVSGVIALRGAGR